MRLWICKFIWSSTTAYSVVLQGGVTTIFTVLTFTTAGQDEVKGLSTIFVCWSSGQAALIVNYVVKVKQLLDD